MERQLVDLGAPVTGDRQRDAVHIAVIPVEAGEELLPGQWGANVRRQGLPHRLRRGCMGWLGVYLPCPLLPLPSVKTLVETGLAPGSVLVQ
jgi:hypothetical protein